MFKLWLNPYDGKPYCAECQYGYFYGTDGKCKNCQEDGNLANCKKYQELGKMNIFVLLVKIIMNY